MRTYDVWIGRLMQSGLCAALLASSGHWGHGQDPFAPARLEPAIAAEAEPLPAETAPNEPAPGELQGSISLPEDATLRRRLAHATRLAQSGRLEDAALALGRLAEAIGEADVFVRLDQRQSLRSLKTEVQRRIGELPPDGRAAYELAFARAAQRMLDDAGGDRSVIRRVATLYLHTPAGAEALYRLAGLYRDRGAFPEAAACLEQLRTQRPEAVARFEPQLSLQLAANRLKCGDATAASAVVADLSRRFPDRVADIAGTKVPLGVTADGSLASLEPLFGTGSLHESHKSFTHHPGEADASPPAAGMPFLVPRWSHELGTNETAATGGKRTGAGGSSQQTIPVLFPTIVGDLVLLPQDGGFTAYDRHSGLRLWGIPTDAPGEPTASAVWSDLANGRLSSDGHAVFLVESDDMSTLTSAAAAPTINLNGINNFNAMFAQQANIAVPGFPFGGMPESSTPGPWITGGNRLSALDVSRGRQGNRLWSVGGTTGGVSAPLAGHTFLGPPLAVHGRLYAIAEATGTVRLVVLDAATGRLDWSLDLGHGEIPLAADPQRQQIGATPTLAGGILICPTAGGAVVAVDLAGRSLLWGYRYPRSSPPSVFGINDGFAAPVEMSSNGWLDRTVHVAGRRVLLTPPESDRLYCLDFETGQLLWQLPRGEHQFVAAADDEHTLLIRQTGTTLLKIADGRPVGTSAIFPAGTSPAGHGFLSAGRYVQPLSDASLVSIDLATGDLSVLLRSTRNIVLGNLVWHDGILYSAGATFLRAFDDDARLAEELEARLAANTDDVPALLRRADRHSVAGRFGEAIADCRKAYSVSPTPTTKNALVAALLDGVRMKLPDAETYDAELRKLAQP